MTIASTTNKVRTDGTGAETEFNFTFKVFSASDLKVYLIDNAGDPTLLELTTHYTVAIDDPGPGGTVTMVTPPAADEELLIVREVALTQTTDIPVRGSLREPQIEFVYDRLVMMIQQLQEEIDRCVKVGVASETSEVPAFPAAVEDNVLGWDDSGNLKNIVLGTAVAAIITAAISTATADAEAAQTAAEAAQTAAEAAQTAAETAETNAETAETNAETAQTAAEVAQAAAEAAAAGVNLPSINGGDAYKLLRANAGETAFELVAIKDEDDMVSDSATDVPSQQSVKAYIASQLVLAVPTGSMFQWLTDTAPTGYLLCYGQAISRTTYTTLFGIIGTTFGVGDGSTTFNLPDLRGRIPLGQDDMGGSSANRVTNAQADTLGGVEGAETHTLITSEMPAHTHSYEYGGGGSAGASFPVRDHNNPVTAPNPTGSTGGDGAHNNMQPYITVNYIVKI